MGRKKNDEIPKSDFEVNESQDLLSFDSNENLGECIASFSFGNSSYSDIDISSNHSSINNTEKETLLIKSNTEKITNISNNNKSQDLFDNRTTPIANGAAPLIEGEVPDIKRTYMLRNSTVRKLNELKTIHPDINVCVSTIVDIALAHYYKYITEEGGIQ
ncbi:hypothetical protein [Clostridium sp.]|uniref:hypothetical protein n=1 Tax=Clostridium sp. TaxID=1506 RepID=UPI00290BB1F2|nr:hypothetical protein [Clostridium sp.]MDU4848485.1 hypothetical protein [Clostridium sp.]